MESPEERFRNTVKRGVDCISTAFARYMEEITILPVDYERRAHRWLIRDGGRYTIIVYPFLLEKVIEMCRDILSEMQAYATTIPVPGMVTMSPEILVGLAPIPYLTLPTYYDPNDPILIETTRKFVRNLIPKWMRRKFRRRPLVLKDLGERGENYEIIFGVIYTHMDWRIKKALFDIETGKGIFASAGREYALHLLSAVTGRRISVGHIRRLLMMPKEVVKRERREVAVTKELRRRAERRNRVIEECVIPSLPVKWWVDVLSRYYDYLTVMHALSEEDIREHKEMIRSKLLEGRERLSSAWRQWKEPASYDLRLFQSVNIILELLKTIDGFKELLERIEFAMKEVSSVSRPISIPSEDPQAVAKYCVYALRTILSSDEHMDAFIYLRTPYYRPQ